MSRRTEDRSWVERIPVVTAAAARVRALAARRDGPVPTGLLMLLPVAVLIDIFDVGDELVGGPVGMGLSFLVESAFLLGVTGRASWSLGAAAVDLIPIVDTLPMATLTLLGEILRQWGEAPIEGPVVDVERA